MATIGLSPNQKLSAARLMAVRRCPYFTQALMALVPRASEAVPTMAVSENLVMVWNPKAVDRWTVQQTAAVLLHEVGHIIRDHARRGRAMGAEPKKWNTAGDAEINDDIVAMGLDLPDGPVLPKNFDPPQPDGLTAEEYYRVLPPDKDGGGGGVGSGQCGSCANGEGVEGEAAKDDPCGRSQVDITRIQKDVAAAVKEHVEQHGHGSVPGGLERWADGMLKPAKVRWQDKLARNVRTAVAYRPGAVDLRFSKPSRKQAGVGFGAGRPILPAMVAPVPRVMVAIDTSGSMAQKELERAVSECSGIFKTLGAPVDFVSCDAEVNATVKARTWQDIARNLKGGGGTDFRPVFEAAEKMRPRPEVLVFVTDGCGPSPTHPPYPLKVIWLLVGPYRQKPMVVAETNGQYTTSEVGFGDFIEVNDGDEESEDDQ